MERIGFDAVRRLAGSVPTVCLLAPMPDAGDDADGYLHRIRTIDETALSSFVRVYLMGDRPDLARVVAEKRDEHHYFLQFNSKSIRQRRQIFSLIRSCGRLYIHSVYRFVAGPVSRRMAKALDLPGVRIVWDVHGAAPEEIEMNGELPAAARAAEIERALYRRSGAIVCVSRAMEEHLRSKYGPAEAEVLILPIFAADGDQPPEAPEKTGGRPVVVYAGGLQRWQCVEEMIRLIDSTWDRFDYRIYTPDPEELMARWGPGEGKNHITVASVPHREMPAAYRGCQYGLLLREDNAVNRVACPTKLIEYIRYGIVPVLQSSRIGDFAALGLAWVEKEDLLAGNVPDGRKLEEIRSANRTVLEKTAELTRRGMESLRRCMETNGQR